MRLIRIALALISATLILVPGVFAQNTAVGEVRERQLGERVLGLGSWGADVFTLQLRLQELGYELQADGLFGRETQATVMRFQREHGIDPTGSVGPITLERLSQALIGRVETMPYTVQPGDSLWSIARAFDTTMELLIELNDLPDRPLRAGEEIQVPALLRHTVKPGDTLWEIARMYHTDVEAIAALNRISAEDTLKVGAVLWLPRGAFLLGGGT